MPDERNRARFGLDTLSVSSATLSGRITAAGSGINGTTMGAAGGSEFLQQHTHSVTDPGHGHTVKIVFSIVGGVVGSVLNAAAVNNATTNLTVNNIGSGSGQNMPPAIISFLPLVKT